MRRIAVFFLMQPKRTRRVRICSGLLAAWRRDVHAANGAIAQRFPPRTEEFGRTPAGAGVDLPGAFDQAGAVEQPAEILLVQLKPGDRLDHALQVQQREVLRRQFEDDGAIFYLGAQASDRRRQDAPVIRRHRFA